VVLPASWEPRSTLRQLMSINGPGFRLTLGIAVILEAGCLPLPLTNVPQLAALTSVRGFISVT